MGRRAERSARARHSDTVIYVDNEQGVPDWMLRVARQAAQDAEAAVGDVLLFIRAAEQYVDEARKAHAASGPIRGWADQLVLALEPSVADLIEAYRRPIAFRNAIAHAGLASAGAIAGDVGAATLIHPPAALSREAFLTWLAVLVGFAFLAARANLSAEAQNAINYCCGVIGVVLGFIAVIQKR